ncbi:hypothetical protein JZX87_13835 [Agrobacterium sp. Ap1]|uniref:hypothetical protein n=1 Tax=Agrobacterium sp. Ap1 TaxID=2815337 RepID=UPI001A8FCDE2|nr:hypothetical protein [Agrobacterium sp. Ap1]MBO0142243.1 hypothetical protein [Agrobacterium sp. Ap1]
MDLIKQRLLGKALLEIQHSENDCGIFFEGGGITAWTEVRVSLAFGNDPLIVRDVQFSSDWCQINFDTGEIRIGRKPNSSFPEFFAYGSADDPGNVIVDRGDE